MQNRYAPEPAQPSNFMVLGSNTQSSSPLTGAPPSSGQSYYADSAPQAVASYGAQGSNWAALGYNPTFSEFVARPPESYKSPSTVTRAEQETNSREVQKISVQKISVQKISVQKSSVQKSSVQKSSVQKSSKVASEQVPDLSSLEKKDTRSQESVSRRLSVISEFPIVRKQLFNLFDLIPGLEACEMHQGLCSKRVYAMIQYSNVASAIFAQNRLNGFEYPFGNYLLVSFIEDEEDETDLIQHMATELVKSELSASKDNSGLQLQDSAPRIPSPRLETDAELPSRKKKAPPDSSERERLSITFDPLPLPQEVLDNVLSRFGNFINAYLIPGKNMAYAMFAERSSASDVIAGLHGKTVNGVKLKVTLADLPMEDSSKHQRIL